MCVIASFAKFAPSSENIFEITVFETCINGKNYLGVKNVFKVALQL